MLNTHYWVCCLPWIGVGLWLEFSQVCHVLQLQCAAALLFLENTVSLKSPLTWLLESFCPSSTYIPEPRGKGYDTECHLEMSILKSLHVDQLWVFVLIATYKKLLMRVEWYADVSV